MKLMRARALFGTHPIYQEIVNNPPENVVYSGVSKKTLLGKYYQSKKITTKLSRIFQIFHLPRMVYIPNIKEDLIHSSRGIIILNKKPWVIDLEHPASFAGMDPELWKKSSLLRKIVKEKLASPYCKKIMMHCEASKKDLLNTLNCSEIKDKLEVLYPATHIPKRLKKTKRKKKIVILSVLSLFYAKGGLYVLEAFSRLEKKYKNVELWIKSDVPEEIKQKYNSRNIKYFPYKTEILPREELLKKYYMNADIFLYPTFADTFGYSLLDAMIARLPIVASDNFAIPEIVEDGKNGYIIKFPFSFSNEGTKIDNKRLIKTNKKVVEEIAKKCSKLIKNKRLRRKMGNYGYKLVSKRKFSIKERNKKLLQIYREAIK